MLESVDVGERTLSEYESVASAELIDRLRVTARALKGARVLHLSATPYGGGVAELLRSVVPLLNDLGLVAHWRLIRGDEEFFAMTKAIHNGLQGSAVSLSSLQVDEYLEHSRATAAAFDERYDFVFVHDPQPAGILRFRGKDGARWIWRCHVDTSQPNAEVWGFLRPFLVDFDAAVFTMPEFVPPDFPIGRVEIIPPAIDPLSPKNLHLPKETARSVLSWLGVHLRRPLITQVSRFDPWKDPMGVIRAYRLAREEVPELRLVLVGSMALDDPQGWAMYRTIRDETSQDPLIHVFTNLVGVGNIEVNAFQALSAVVIQKSLREGFGLVVSEAMWKGTPVVATRAGGIPLQMADGAGGILVDGDEEACARAVVELVRDPARAAALGAAGRERVRRHFLTPRMVLNELNLMAALAAERPAIPLVSSRNARTDPVCGMVLQSPFAPTATLGEVVYGFCSERCRAAFLESPAHYVRPGPASLSH